MYRSIRKSMRPTIYFPLAQRDDPLLFSNFFIAVRSETELPARLTRSVAAALNAVSPNLTLTFRPLAQQVSESLAQERLLAMLSGFFSALGLLLAALGLYGVTSYAVTRRRSEISIRLALGADSAGIVRLVLRRVVVLVGIGLLAGVCVSLWASRFVSTLLYGIQARDPVTLVASALLLGAVAVIAGWLPARQAARLDPADVLRNI